MEATHPSGQSPLRGRYLASDWRLRGLLALSDLLLAPLHARRRVELPRPPRRVLLALGGHLGDAVIATAAVRLLADALPDAELGVLLPGWSRVVFDEHPRVRRVHSVDHWHSSRSADVLRTKWNTYRRTRRAALLEVRAEGYDAAVDLYDYFPNSAAFLWRAGIPVRIGFTSAGFAPLYTHLVQWRDDLRHTAERQADLLRVLAPSIGDSPVIHCELPPASPVTAGKVELLLAQHELSPRRFTVMHMGAGSPLKAWSLNAWREVAMQLVARGEKIVFTGQGSKERDDIRMVTAGIPACVDLSGQLDWPSFVHVIRLARRLLAVDTVAGHVAAAVGTPCTTLWTGISSPQHWRPLADVGDVLMHQVPCAPCFRDDGCASMRCIRELAVPEVLASLRESDQEQRVDSSHRHRHSIR